MGGKMIKKYIKWEVPMGAQKEILADLISICYNHDDWSEEKSMLITLSIDKWYRILPLELKRIVDSGSMENYDVIIEEVEGLPI